MNNLKLPNGRIVVGPNAEEEYITAWTIERDRLQIKIDKLSPKVEADLNESRERHRKLWNY